LQQHLTSIIVIAGLVLWSIYRRIRRNIGWQQLNPRRMGIRITIFSAIGIVFLSLGVVHPVSLVSDIIGIMIGTGLAYYGGTLTQFEQREGRWYYQPNPWIGGLVTVIFLGRFLFRIYKISLLEQTGAFQAGQSNQMQTMNDAVGNSWGAGLILIMFAYYIVYYFLILRRQKRGLQTKEIIDSD